jgi:hypothetical protein
MLSSSFNILYTVIAPSEIECSICNLLNKVLYGIDLQFKGPKMKKRAMLNSFSTWNLIEKNPVYSLTKPSIYVGCIGYEDEII